MWAFSGMMLFISGLFFGLGFLFLGLIILMGAETGKLLHPGRGEDEWDEDP